MKAIEATPNIDKKNTKNIPAVLLAGALSMFFAEVMAGSSNLWFLQIFGILNTYILYLTHLLFYLNFAVRTKRTSLPQLYLWGMLFALYEAPITQVLWSGYMDSTPLLPPVLDIAIVEFLVLVFFWHPVMSFIIPILIYESLVFSENKNDIQCILPNHEKLMHQLHKKKKWFYIVLGIFAINQTKATGFNYFITFGAYGGSILIILILWCLTKNTARKTESQPSITNLILTPKGFRILIFIFILYVYGWISYFISTLLPGRWPDIIGYLMIGLVACIIIIVIRYTPQISLVNNSPIQLSNSEFEVSATSIFFTKADFFKLFACIFIGAIFYLLFPSIGEFMSVFVYLSFPFIGIILVAFNFKALSRLRKNYEKK